MGLDVRLELLLIGALIAAAATRMEEPVCAILRPWALDLDPDSAAVLDGAEIGNALVASDTLSEREAEPTFVGKIFLDLSLESCFRGWCFSPAAVALLHRSQFVHAHSVSHLALSSQNTAKTTSPPNAR